MITLLLSIGLPVIAFLLWVVNDNKKLLEDLKNDTERNPGTHCHNSYSHPLGWSVPLLEAPTTEAAFSPSGWGKALPSKLRRDKGNDTYVYFGGTIGGDDLPDR